MIKINAIIDCSELSWINCFWRKHPFRSSIRCVQLTKQLGHPKITKFKLNSTWFSWPHFVFSKCSKHIPEMYILMCMLIQVEVVHCLKNASCNRN